VSRVEAEAIASLCAIVQEIACGLATGEQPSRGWAFDVVKSLAEHAEEVGFDKHITPEQIAEWEGLEEEDE
jgi:hypothetical protein